MTTLYFAGGEDTSFILSSIFSYNPSANYYRTGYARASICPIGSTGLVNPVASYAATPQLGALTSFWIHARANHINNFTPPLNHVIMAVYDSGGLARILVLGTGTAGQIKLCTCNTAGTITTLVTSAAGAIVTNLANAPPAWDLFVNYAVSGQVTLYVNGVNIADTGAGVNVTTNSITSVSQAVFAGCDNGSGGGNGTAWSEVIIQDTSTLGLALVTLPPLAAGNTQSWTPNTVGDVNAVQINDVNFVAATAANALSEWTVATTLPTGTWTIEAVVQEARVSIGATGPQHFEWLVRTTDGSDHVTGSVAATTGFVNYSNIWTTNPHTAAAWLAGDLINAGIESLT